MRHAYAISRGILSALLMVAATGTVSGLGPKIKKPEMPIDEETGKITYQDVIEIEGASKSELFARANAWVAQSYKSANDVVQLRDEDNARLIIKGGNYWTIGGWIPMDYTLRYSVIVEAKEGRYRYTVSDIMVNDRPVEIYDFYPKKNEAKLLRLIDPELVSVVESILAAMQTSSPAGSDDW